MKNVIIRKRSKQSQTRVIEEAVAFFGPEGLGMDVVERVECCVYFMGGRGGHVRIQAHPDDRGTMVEMNDRGWKQPVEEFFARI